VEPADTLEDACRERQRPAARDRVIREGKLGKIGLVEVYCYYHMRGRGNPADTNPPENLEERIVNYRRGLANCTEPVGKFVNDTAATFTTPDGLVMPWYFVAKWRPL